MPHSSRKVTAPWVMALIFCACLVATPLHAANTRTLLVLGDSLSAAYGIPVEQGWVNLLAERLQPQGWRVVNASISGETTAGGASRIERELAAHRPDLVVVELGANDGLRGLPLDRARANLQRIIDASRAAGADVALIGMRIQPNYGPDYTRQFTAMYQSLAEANGVPLLPFLLEAILDDPDAFQADRLHPTASVQPRLRDAVIALLQPLL